MAITIKPSYDLKLFFDESHSNGYTDFEKLQNLIPTTSVENEILFNIVYGLSSNPYFVGENINPYAERYIYAFVSVDNNFDFPGKSGELAKQYSDFLEECGFENINFFPDDIETSSYVYFVYDSNFFINPLKIDKSLYTELSDNKFDNKGYIPNIEMSKISVSNYVISKFIENSKALKDEGKSVFGIEITSLGEYDFSYVGPNIRNINDENFTSDVAKNAENWFISSGFINAKVKVGPENPNNGIRYYILTL